MRLVLRALRHDPLVTIANTIPALLATLVLTLLGFAGVFSVVEHIDYQDALYWSVVTMSTTGYGDISPATDAGRLVAGALMLWSIFFLLPAAIYHVAERLIQDRDEWSHEEQVQLRTDLHEIKGLLNNIRAQSE
jgi:voltage-gated potassium channel